MSSRPKTRTSYVVVYVDNKTKHSVKRGGTRNMMRFRNTTETQEGMSRMSTINICYFSVRRNHSLDVLGAAVPDHKRR